MFLISNYQLLNFGKIFDCILCTYFTYFINKSVTIIQNYDIHIITNFISYNMNKMNNKQTQTSPIVVSDSQADDDNDCFVVSSKSVANNSEQFIKQTPVIQQLQFLQQLVVKPQQQKQTIPLIIKFNDHSNSKTEQQHLKQAIPWMTQDTASISDALVRLHNEVIDFYNYIRPNKMSNYIRMLAFNQLKATITSLLPKAQVHIFGSFATQLYLPDGDIDLVVLTKMNYTPDQVYEKIYYTLRKNPTKYIKLVYIRRAKVPIIKFVCGRSKIPFDISVDQFAGFQQIQYVRRINSEYPEFKYLVFVFKCFFVTRELSDTYKGGIGSFLLFSLLHVYLQEANRQKSCNCSLGQHIIKFLQFYGETDWSWRVIYVKYGVIEHRQREVGTFSCISPQDPDRDIGRAAYRSQQIFRIFDNRVKMMLAANFYPKQSILAVLLNPCLQKFRYLLQDVDY